MCFSNDDYDWTVAESQVDTVTANPKLCCYDCGLPFMDGQSARRTEQWEYEQCPECGKRHSEDNECEDIEKDCGESAVEYQCQACVDFRTAIKDMEMEEGCDEYEATPNAQLAEEFGNMGDHARVRQYIDHASEMFPQHAEFYEARYGRFAGNDDE